MERFELTVNDEPGALAHLVALVTSRRWKLRSLSYPAADSGRRKIIVDLDTGGRGPLIEAQMGKLYDVLGVRRIIVSGS